MNVLRYCNLDESLQGEETLVCNSALERLFKTRELDYMSYIVLRMFENVEVNKLFSLLLLVFFFFVLFLFSLLFGKVGLIYPVFHLFFLKSFFFHEIYIYLYQISPHLSFPDSFELHM